MSSYVSCNKAHPRAGFTLIEMLVSITIMAMVATVVLSAMRSGLSIWDKGENHLEAVRHSRLVTDILGEQLRSALPLTYTLRNGGQVTVPLAFEGARTGVRFVTRTSFKDGPDGIAHWVNIRWIRAADASTGDLAVEERRILPPDNLPESGIYWSGLVLHGDNCSFDFLAAAQGNRPAMWLQEWRYPASPTLPKAVRMKCTVSGKETVQLLLPLDYAASSAQGFTLR